MVIITRTGETEPANGSVFRFGKVVPARPIRTARTTGPAARDSRAPGRDKLPIGQHRVEPEAANHKITGKPTGRAEVASRVLHNRRGFRRQPTAYVCGPMVPSLPGHLVRVAVEEVVLVVGIRAHKIVLAVVTVIQAVFRGRELLLVPVVAQCREPFLVLEVPEPGADDRAEEVLVSVEGATSAEATGAASQPKRKLKKTSGQPTTGSGAIRLTGVLTVGVTVDRNGTSVVVKRPSRLKATHQR